MRWLTKAAVAVLLCWLVIVPCKADSEVTTVRLGVQPGLAHLPWAVIRHEHLIEQEAKKRGLTLTAEWHQFAGGDAMNSAILSDSIDFMETGPPSLIILWDRTNGTYKGLGASGAMPMELVTRNPNIHSIKDFTDKDRIAVPAVKVSTQAILLEMAAEQVWGKDQYTKLDSLTITRSHPDAVAALLDKSSEIDAHFSLPPYLEIELATPGIHAVLSAQQVLGASFLNGVLVCSRSFHDKNPKVVAATVAALDDALALIRQHPRQAAEIYLDVSHEKNTVAAIETLIKAPGTSYERTPHGVERMAAFMHSIGMIKHDPASWKDFFFGEARNLAGN
jgi:NitT/TauT family transport system substrate-binding protein